METYQLTLNICTDNNSILYDSQLYIEAMISDYLYANWSKYKFAQWNNHTLVINNYIFQVLDKGEIDNNYYLKLIGDIELYQLLNNMSYHNKLDIYELTTDIGNITKSLELCKINNICARINTIEQYIYYKIVQNTPKLNNLKIKYWNSEDDNSEDDNDDIKDDKSEDDDNKDDINYESELVINDLYTIHFITNDILDANKSVCIEINVNNYIIKHGEIYKHLHNLLADINMMTMKDIYNEYYNNMNKQQFDMHIVIKQPLNYTSLYSSLIFAIIIVCMLYVKIIFNGTF